MERAYRSGLMVLAAGIASMLAGCATITTGTDQTLAVITVPPGAVCELTREGVTIAVVNPTPGTVNLEKDKDAVSVRCEKDGHFDGVEVIAASFRGMTFGNIILGGFIGLGVDAASGAMHHYPPNVTVVLPPERFASAAARDAFYDRQASRIEAEAKVAIEAARKACGGDSNCLTPATKAVEAARDAKLQALEAQREATVLD